MCHRMVGRFKYWCAFLCSDHQPLFSYIIFSIHYINKYAQQLSWWLRWLAGIGTWVRFPGPPYFSIILVVTCSGEISLQWSTMCAYDCACQVSRKSHSKVRMWRFIMHASQPFHTQFLKVKKGFIIGPKMLQTYLQIGSATPMVCIFLLFILIILFILLFVLLSYLIQKK